MNICFLSLTITPQPHKSTLFVYGCLKRISGAIYSGVPHVVVIFKEKCNKIKLWNIIWADTMEFFLKNNHMQLGKFSLLKVRKDHIAKIISYCKL